MTIREFAPAKINLTLHVTGQQSDGYHLIDSLVAFADIGDWVAVDKAPEMHFTVRGPRAMGVPTDDSNLVLRAADLMLSGQSASITLEKHLPAASGIGGGSADAAAMLRAIHKLYKQPLPSAPDILSLGADVPICLESKTARMQGIGEVLTPIPALPPVWVVLVNPGVEISTPRSFKALASKENPSMPEIIPVFKNLGEMTAWLLDQRNDLQPGAIAMEPVIGDVLAALATTKKLVLTRMSGSGATCFGLYATEEDASIATRSISVRHPEWWVATGTLGSGVN
ncbi:4-(cytidine 5'-diphospho)-2-C-methyl-D-erythritol kinase [Pseudohalocynthiibacter sp. F2068]|jgi:4-diphosphocytidyl-2-C-methyl-D-erythritol kinase|uniref:4-(cytidine 5'-diphospho)-2-C-methyl-D-erythritol kinase n=1 Tax=Pseudohalocynthiibacter sp. F2068 TaxID=2926418 RepID=UPI001FF2FF59|nr:4-(cytidine 5'-diphospho)-2-C-methyl-D-erythritol kinase [Pseudohalocynthiibacter sp. F2068]MCK0102178.1 4-(cytidine 5'-diphospho)-2-C-methyl-D-erythritol kinase [Pseudohalocynthiibacter sp. F2068]